MLSSALPCLCNIDKIETIKQSTYYHCSAACIKMCTNTKLSQDKIYEILHEKTVDKETWYADPDSVYDFLKSYLSIDRTSNEIMDSKTATEKIISSYLFKKLSAPMLVLGGKHWVLYSGYQMDNKGELKGIYIRDPWPTAATLTFYPFSPYFFDEYFCKINVAGSLEGRVESFVAEGDMKKIDIHTIDKPHNGGALPSKDILYFKDDIIHDDLVSYGFSYIRFLKNGGAMLPDCIVKNNEDETKFLLSFLEVNGQLSLVAVDVENRLVVGMTDIDFDSGRWYNKKDIVQEYESLYGKDINEDEVEYIYDNRYCRSCFDPLVRIHGQEYTLHLGCLSQFGPCA